jgi:antitoxin component of RelBE/YafQ-DinJ toxin-antitoxin module
MKDKFIQVRIEKETKAKAEKKAHALGFSNISEWVRTLIRLAVRK